MLHRTHTLLLASGLLMWSSLACADGVYTWKDADGRTHFGDQPPTAVKNKAEEIEIRSQAPGTDKNAREIQQRANRLFEANKQTQKAEQIRAAEAGSAKAQQCATAKQQANTLSGRVYFEDENGKPYTVTEQERRQRLQELQAWIAENCR